MTPRGRETAPGARDGAGRGIAYLTPAEAALRSTAIVAVLEATGGNLLAAKEMARHENIATTIGQYAQDAAEARVAAAEAMDRVMARKIGG